MYGRKHSALIGLIKPNQRRGSDEDLEMTKTEVLPGFSFWGPLKPILEVYQDLHRVLRNFYRFVSMKNFKVWSVREFGV